MAKNITFSRSRNAEREGVISGMTPAARRKAIRGMPLRQPTLRNMKSGLANSKAKDYGMMLAKKLKKFAGK